MRAVLFLPWLLAINLLAEVLPEDRGAAGLRHALKQLSTDARVLYVTAHPDDEDPALLTYLSRGLGAKVTMLILNRGEGGANVISADFFESLGVLRTAEMLKAAQYYGVDVRFGRTVDYGFSKNIGEALRQWNEDELVKDVLTITRQVRPHVIISRFNESERDGHGHHQTAGRMAKRAFRESATASWKPLKLYTTNWREGESVTLKINTGEYDPVLGRSYAQIGRDGYRWHRSQGMAANIPRPGPVWSYLKLEGSNVGEATSEQSVFDRIDHRVEDEDIAAVWRAYDAAHPERCAPPLAQAWQRLKTRRPAIQRALALALGLEFEALIEPDQPLTGPFAMFRPVETLQVAQPGQSLRARMVLHQRGAEQLESVRYGVKGPIELTPPDPSGVYKLRILPEATPTATFWSRPTVRDSMYLLTDNSLLGQATPESGIRATANFVYRGVAVTIESDFETSSVDTRAGAQRQPLAIGPPVSVQFSSDFGMVPIGKRDYELTVTVRNLTTTRQRGELKLRLPEGFTLTGTAPAFDLAKEKEEARIKLMLRLPSQLASRDYPIHAVATIGTREYTSSFLPISQPGLRVLYQSKPTLHALRAVDVKLVSGLKVGYVMGSGDEVPEGLRQLGIAVETLSESSLASANLNAYSTI
ncbi:MAG: PIG-L family deacetylase, partial [Chloroflexia bacterium]